MALITCPHCQQQVSDIAANCAHCGGVLPKARPEYKQPLYSALLMAQSYLAILMTLGGALWYYQATDGLTHPPASNWSIYLIATGIVWYAGLRLWMLIGKIARFRANRSH